MSILAELRRRHVFRVAGLYLVVAWLLLQASNILESSLRLPSWFDGLVTALVLLGFPLALVFAWAFEVTPEGVKLTAPEEGEGPAARPFDVAVLLGLVVVTGLIFVDRFSGPAAATAEKDAPEATLSSSPKKASSIAVLPFVDLSPEGDQEYFSDGLSEEILNVLARETALRVAGRTSSFAFKGKNIDLREVAKALNVTHVLEGSVRKSGSRIRVTVQLIEADGGFHAFSENYDRELREVFAVQDDIAQRVARAMNIRLSSSSQPKAISVEAYELFLEARDGVHSRQKVQLDRAEVLIDRVLSLAPNYAPAHALKALVTILLTNSFGTYGTRPPEEGFAKARTEIQRALELDPNLADAHAVLGLLRSTTPEEDGDPIEALDRALALNPNDSNARHWRVNAGPKSLESFAQVRETVDRDPGFAPAVNELFSHLVRRREYVEAEALLSRYENIPGSGAMVETYRAYMAFERGQLAEAHRLVQASIAKQPNMRANHRLAGEIFLFLGEFERAETAGDPSLRIQARLARGDVAGALEALEALQDNPLYLSAMISAYLAAGQPADVVASFERFYGPITDLQSTSRLDHNEYALPSMVYAYRQLGREAEAATALALAQALVQRMLRLGYGDSSPGRIVRAEVAAAAGDREASLGILQSFLDKRMATANTGPSFLNALLSKPELRKLIQELWSNVDRERAELGWKPFVRPDLERLLSLPRATKERPSPP